MFTSPYRLKNKSQDSLICQRLDGDFLKHRTLQKTISDLALRQSYSTINRIWTAGSSSIFLFTLNCLYFSIHVQ